jgi:hypothetical protein
MGALTENHRCPRRTLSRVTQALTVVGVGGGLGTILCFAIEERPTGALLLAAAALGAVLVSALRQAIGKGF